MIRFIMSLFLMLTPLSVYAQQVEVTSDETIEGLSIAANTEKLKAEDELPKREYVEAPVTEVNNPVEGLSASVVTN